MRDGCAFVVKRVPERVERIPKSASGKTMDFISFALKSHIVWRWNIGGI